VVNLNSNSLSKIVKNISKKYALPETLVWEIIQDVKK